MHIGIQNEQEKSFRGVGDTSLLLSWIVGLFFNYSCIAMLRIFQSRTANRLKEARLSCGTSAGPTELCDLYGVDIWQGSPLCFSSTEYQNFFWEALMMMMMWDKGTRDVKNSTRVIQVLFKLDDTRVLGSNWYPNEYLAPKNQPSSLL